MEDISIPAINPTKYILFNSNICDFECLVITK